MPRAIPLASILTCCFVQGDCGLSFGFLGQCESSSDVVYLVGDFFGFSYPFRFHDAIVSFWPFHYCHYCRRRRFSISVILADQFRSTPPLEVSVECTNYSGGIIRLFCVHVSVLPAKMMVLCPRGAGLAWTWSTQAVTEWILVFFTLRQLTIKVDVEYYKSETHI